MKRYFFTIFLCLMLTTSAIAGFLTVKAEDTVYSVTLDPGEGTGEPITYWSDDQDYIDDDYLNAGNCRFYYEGDGIMGFKLRDTYCPAGFTAPSGRVFAGWNETGTYLPLYGQDTTFTAQWKADPLLTLGPIADITKIDGGYIWMNGINWHVIGSSDTAQLLISADTLLADGAYMNWTAGKNYCDALYDNFSDCEKSAVIPTTKADGDYDRDASYKFAAAPLSDAKLFMLSGAEVYWYFDDTNSARRPGGWWLRSKFIGNQSMAGVVERDPDGFMAFVSPGSTNYGIRPAFLLDMSKVLFMSGAKGKPNAVIGSGKFGMLDPETPEGRKLTLLDEGRKDFVAYSENTVVRPGGELKIYYSNAGTGDYEYVSALLETENGTYYASESPDEAGSGEWLLTIPEELQEHEYILKVFSEKRNNAYESDCASPFTEITVTVKNTCTITFVNDDGSLLRTAEVEYGRKPVYTGEVPTKEPDAQYTYTFAGWTPVITDAAGDATYTATYTATVNEYMIEFVNDDGEVLQSTDEAYGTTPVYDGPTPEKDPDPQYRYTFIGWTPEITAVTGDAVYTAKYSRAASEYTITFKNEDGAILQTGSVSYGETPEYTGSTPVKNPTVQYSYTFAGWTPAVTMATDDATYTATYSAAVRSYTVEFVTEGGAVLQSDSVPYGEMPEYSSGTPVKTGDAQYSYTFVGWIPEIDTVDGDATYTASFTKSVNEYTIEFVDDDGTVLQRVIAEYGTLPEYTGPLPVKEPDAQHTYTFMGWMPEITAVTCDATYTATYTANADVYTVTFLNDDDTVLQIVEAAYGTMPEYTGPAPTKAPDARYEYAFAGWMPEITAVTGDAAYTASYTKTARKYSIIFLDEDDSVLQTIEAAYETIPEYTGPAPEKESDEQYTYTFAGWTPDIIPVVGDATYAATYSRTVNVYTITFVNEDGTVLQSDLVEYGEMPEYTGGTPVKDPTVQYTYAFDGWKPAVTAVTCDMTYTAAYTKTLNRYTIEFVDEDGTVLQSDLVEYGEMPEYTGGTPKKAGNAQYSYTFSGWVPDIAAVDGDATYIAAFTQSVNAYNIKFVNEDGTVLQSGLAAYGETPEFTGGIPAKAGDAQFSYTFSGWTPEITAVDGNAVYTATYAQIINEYTVTFVNFDGTVLQSGVYVYGETPEYLGESPVKAPDIRYSYTFSGWLPEITAVDSDATYTAGFTKTINRYTIEFVNEDGTVLQSNFVAYGEMPEYTAGIPKKASDTQYSYTFAGWTPEITAVDGDATYTAKYEKTALPTVEPTKTPTATPNPTETPTAEPTSEPTATPTNEPITIEPTSTPSVEPTTEPISTPTVEPTSEPTATPTNEPTNEPITIEPTSTPTVEPTTEPTSTPTVEPTSEPTSTPTVEPMIEPTLTPTVEPTIEPTSTPTVDPTSEPTAVSTIEPTHEQTMTPTVEPTTELTSTPTVEPTTEPTSTPTVEPTSEVTSTPTIEPTIEPTLTPTADPTSELTATPTIEPTTEPTAAPSVDPTSEATSTPTVEPTTEPTLTPTADPTSEPTSTPTVDPTSEPTAVSTIEPTTELTSTPTVEPTSEPTTTPTVEPTSEPIVTPTVGPTTEPTATPTITATPTTTVVPMATPTAVATPTVTAPLTETPTVTPTPTETPPIEPATEPTVEPTVELTAEPTASYTPDQTETPTTEPTAPPVEPPTAETSAQPTATPALETTTPTAAPTAAVTPAATTTATIAPTATAAPAATAVPVPGPSATAAITAKPTATPATTPRATTTATPAATATAAPTGKPVITPSATPAATPVQTAAPVPGPGIGTPVRSGGADYVVTAPGEVSYTGPAKSTAKATVPDTIIFEGTELRVTAIADKAFCRDKKLKTVIIGANVETIGAKAFKGCAKLTAVKGGAAVKAVGKNAFNGCKALKKLPVMNEMETIGAGAFKGCVKLTKITLGGKVSSIGANAFNGCKALKTVTVRTMLLTADNVGRAAFRNINKKAVFKCPKESLKAYRKLFVRKGAPKTCRFR